MGYLILVRHGAPCLNPDDWLYGWIDIPLSRKGIEEALDCASNLKISKLTLLLPQTFSERKKLFPSYFPGRKRQGFLYTKEQLIKAG